MNRRILCALALCVAIGGASPALRAQQALVLAGTIVTPATVIDDGAIAMSGGTIDAVGARAAGTVAVDVDGIIFPGLVDLHNHITWNALPRWTPPSLTKNRYEWQEMPEYAKALSGPHTALVSAGFNCDLNRYGELKEIVNGATSTVGSIRDECIRGLARNLEFLSELQPGRGIGEEPFRDEVFPFEVRSSCGEQALRDVGQRLEDCALNSGEAKPIVPRASVAHVAEGIDASARREFSMFAAHGYLKAGNNIIHGVGLRAPHFARMAAAGVGLIWSPRSNIEIYGRTTDVAAAREAGVTIAGAPDWSPSGSSGMLAELAYIDRWQRDPKNAVQAPFTSQQLVEMATIVPARLARLDDRIGRLAPGAAAALIVMAAAGGERLPLRRAGATDAGGPAPGRGRGHRRVRRAGADAPPGCGSRDAGSDQRVRAAAAGQRAHRNLREDAVARDRRAAARRARPVRSATGRDGGVRTVKG